MTYTTPVEELIRRRYSCREYLPEPIPAAARHVLADAAAAAGPGPLGTRPRFALVAATDDDATTLRGLGTYGFIRGAQGFLVGATSPEGAYLEDYGFRMEELVLLATDLGLGSCWLGGTFSRGSFSRRAGAGPGESVPAVVALGRVEDDLRARRGIVRAAAGGSRRRPWEELFFDGGFDTPLTPRGGRPLRARARIAPPRSLCLQQAAVACRPCRGRVAPLSPAHAGVQVGGGAEVTPRRGHAARRHGNRHVPLRAFGAGARARRALGHRSPRGRASRGDHGVRGELGGVRSRIRVDGARGIDVSSCHGDTRCGRGRRDAALRRGARHTPLDRQPRGGSSLPALSVIPPASWSSPMRCGPGRRAPRCASGSAGR